MNFLVDSNKFRSRIFSNNADDVIFNNESCNTLINLQLKSYKDFLYGNNHKDQYLKDDLSIDSGIMNVVRSIFPIIDNSSKFALDIISYTIMDPVFSPSECIIKNITYTVKMRFKVRIVIWDNNTKNDTKEISSIKEQEIYLCDIPLMTENANFIINGYEYVIVSQLHRSPGLLFSYTNSNSALYDKDLCLVRLIPYRGSWLDLEFDNKNLIYCRIDKKRKFFVTTLLRILQYEYHDIINLFYLKLNFEYINRCWYCKNNLHDFIGCKAIVNFLSQDDNVIISVGQIITEELINKLNKNYSQNYECENITAEELNENTTDAQQYKVEFVTSFRLIYADDVYDENGEVLFVRGSDFEEDNLESKLKSDVHSFSIILIDNFKFFPYIINTLILDKNESYEDSLQAFYKIVRPGEMGSVAAAEFVLKSMFFNPDRYDLSDVGRMKINQKLGYNDDVKDRLLRKEDIVDSVKALIELRNGIRNVDDVDDLANRRVRAVGELIENQFRNGIVKCFRNALDKLSSGVDITTLMPFDLLNSKVINALLKDFFNSSQLSQFMDQTNPLAEITHKRRISSLGPGGLTQDRAGFEVRDVHFTHYGRLCAAETPDNNRVGLVNSAALCSRINQYGFIEVPYYKVTDSKVQNEIVFLSAFEERGKNLAQANIKLDQDKKIVDDLIYCRRDLSFVMVDSSEVDYVDITPYQIVSIATSLIPFLENNDASRALMGANMQRQAVPLFTTESPWVGTGMESIVVRDSGAVIASEIDGEVMFVDNQSIIVGSSDPKNLQIITYKLQKYRKSNFNTCINFKPCVNKNQLVKKGELLADGFAADSGELALGRNLITAFLPWDGLNFEDSVVISENVSDMYASIHIEELECVASDTKLGPEIITRDIPDVSGAYLHHLDESGIVHIGSKVKPGDILVGMVAPVIGSPLTPEERLLRMVFGEKISDVKDCSLYVPSGIQGTVIDIQIFSLKGIKKDDYLLSNEQKKIDKLLKEKNDKVNALHELIRKSFKDFINRSRAINDNDKQCEYLCTKENLYKPDIDKLFGIEFESEVINKEILKIKEKYINYNAQFESDFKKRVANIITGDDLANGVLQIVKVFVAMKHCLQPGDKIAGRHGNKGVISKVLPVYDMPHMEDGTPIDIILNPLGVPSRMNIGQIRENHMGWLCYNVNKKLKHFLQSMECQSSDLNALNNQIKEFLLILYKNNRIAKDIENFDDVQLKIFMKDLVTKGFSVSVPVFESPSIDEINSIADKLGIDINDQFYLLDPITGEQYERKVTVGVMYILKLHHLVDHKIHARSVGPYSLVTQQPLGGRSQFGGQRLGEMENWALQAHGAAYNILEMLTVKSDDVIGRLNIYESIVKGENSLKPVMTESFYVLLSELRSLCLDIDLLNDTHEQNEQMENQG